MKKATVARMKIRSHMPVASTHETCQSEDREKMSAFTLQSCAWLQFALM